MWAEAFIMPPPQWAEAFIIPPPQWAGFPPQVPRVGIEGETGIQPKGDATWAGMSGRRSRRRPRPSRLSELEVPTPRA